MRSPNENISIRISRKTLLKLRELADAAGTSRSALIRELCDDFAAKGDELLQILRETKRSAQAETAHAWVTAACERAEWEAQMAMPTGDKATR
jgi:hypothetical protein